MQLVLPPNWSVLWTANRDRPATTVNLDTDFGIVLYLRLRVLHRGQVKVCGDKPRTMQERRREAISDHVPLTFTGADYRAKFIPVG